MKRSIKLYPLTLLFAILVAVSVPLLPPPTPAFASSSHTWSTEADFEAGVLNQVDTSSNPGAVLLATNVDTGTGASGSLVVNGTQTVDDHKAAISLTSPSGGNIVYANTASGPFYVGDEVFIVQMTGTGTGKWEIRDIQSVSATQITLTSNLTNTYSAGGGSAAQVITVHQYENVTVNNGGLLTCDAWNGSTGSVVFFRATGTVSVASGGQINVSGKGFGGGGGGSGGNGAGGSGGQRGRPFNPNGGGGGSSGTGGAGGIGGVSSDGLVGYPGGDGGAQGDTGYKGSGTTGSGPDGGASDTGGANDSSASLSTMQMGGGGGGGSSGVGGYGAGGGGGGGSDTCNQIDRPSAGQDGARGGSPGQGGQGGTGAGMIVIYAKAIVSSQSNFIMANGGNGTAGANGAQGGGGGGGGYGAQMCFVNSDTIGGPGGGGGGGNGGDGGGGGNGGASGGGGTVWLAAANINIPGNGVYAIGGSGGSGGQPGSGGAGGSGGYGGEGDTSDANGKNGARGGSGNSGSQGSTGGMGGWGAIRLDYATLTGWTVPDPGYTSGLYDSGGTIASDVLDTSYANTTWADLVWQETIPSSTDITFEARASNTAFNKGDATPAWTSLGGTSPVTSGLPIGRYMQWRAMLTSTNSFNSPILHQVTVDYTNVPLVDTGSATSIGESSATLNGNLTSLDPAPSVMVSFEWGTGYGSYSWETTPQPMSAPGTFQAPIYGLLNYTTYHYRAKATSTEWGTGYGQDMAFTTSGPPVISTLPADSIGTGSARLNGAVNYYPSTFMDGYFEYGTDPANLYYQTAPEDAQTQFSQTIYGLSPGTTYYFQAWGFDDIGTYTGSILSFTTRGVAPTVSTGNATSVTSTSSTLNGTLVNAGGSGMANVYFQYGTAHGGPYPHTTPPQAMPWPDPFSAYLTGLSADTTYYFRSVGDGGAQGIGYGSEMSFTTQGLKPSVSTDNATSVTSSSATLDGTLVSLGNATTVNTFFQYGTTQGGPYPNSTAPQAMMSTGPFMGNLTGLSANTKYYFRAAGDGGAAGVGYGNEISFTTPGIPPSVSTGNATSVTTNSATLNGTLTNLGTADNVSVSFQYGTTQGGPYPVSTTSRGMTSPGPFTANLTSLSGSTIYYFRAAGFSPTQGGSYGNEMSFTTGKIPPSVSTGNAGSVTSSSATVNGTLTNLGTAGTVNVSFQYGTTHGGPYPNSTSPQAMTSPGPFTASLTSLGANTIYYYRASGDGGAQGVGYGNEMSFTTSPIPPSVSTGNATLVTSSSATLNGALANPGSASTVNVSFQYGTTHGGPYPNSTPAQAMTARGPFSAGLTSLTANTTYYYRAAGDAGAQGVGYGNEVSFTTPPVPPAVTTAGATAITPSSATLNGQVTAMGTASTVNASFEWGTEPDNLNMSTPPQALTAPVGFNANLSNLSPNTTYFFRASGDGGASGMGYGTILSFTTSKVPPSVSTNGATGVTAGSATLNGTLHSLGTAPTVNVSFQYGTASGVYSVETTPQALTSIGNFSAPTGGLAAATTYYFRAKGNGGIHGTSYGAEQVFTTSSIPPSVTTGTVSNLTTNSAALNGNLDSLGSAATVNVSFQYGTSQGGPYTNSTPSQAKTATGAFHIGVTGLRPATTYYYRAKADGGTNGTGYGVEASFSTGMFTPYVETVPAIDQTDTTATLNGDLYSLGSATTVNVSFQYGTTHGGPYPNSTPQQAMAATGAFQAAISGLNPGTTYYFRARGDGGVYGVANGAEMSFTTSRLPPVVGTQAATDINSDNATLNGSLDSLGDASTVNVSFLWGTQPGGPYTDSTPQQARTATGAFQAGLGGLQGNTTYYYRARGDGGINGGAYGVERSFTTPMVPPSVTTDNARNVTPASAALHGFLDSMGTAPSVDVRFKWGVTQGGPYPNTTPPQTMDARGYFRADIIGLTPLTTYYFRAMADGSVHGSAQGQERSFTTGATPPSVSTGGATVVTADSATLNGSLHSLGTATVVNVAFQYGTSPGVYSEQTASQVLSDPGDFLANLSSLQPHTTYYYRAIADGGENGVSYGTQHVFTTGFLPPTATTDPVSEKTTDTATLNGNLDNLGSSTTVMVSFQYGTTAGGPYPDSTSPQAKTSTGAFQAGLSGLTPFTTYYYKAKADGGLNGAGYGAEMSFTTNYLPPVVWTGGASDIITNAATLNGNLYLMGSAPTADVSFEYGTTKGGPYPNSTPPQTMNEPDAFLSDVTGLTPDTTYYFVAKAAGGIHGTSYGDEQAFTTGSFPPSVSTSDATNITASSATLNGDLRFLGSATTVNVSFEYGTTQGGPYPNVTTPQTMTATGVFDAGVSGLSANTAYYFRAKADGGIYGASYGAEMSFITSGIPPAVTTQNASNITTTAARLNGNLNSLGSSTFANVSFQWGTTPGVYNNETTAQIMNATGAFFADLTGLTRNTNYYFRAKAVGDGTGYGVEQSFATSGASDGVETATDVGIAYFSSDAGNIQNLVAVAERTLPATGKPSGLSFLDGFFSFTIVNVTPGSTVTITITLPSNMPANTQYWKYQNGTWMDCTSLMGDNDGDNVITLIITDGGRGDADGVANGTIVDPGGPGMVATSVPSTTARRVSPSLPSQLPPADVRLHNISVSPNQAQVGQSVTVLANVVNNGASSGGYNVVLRINGKVEQQRIIEVSPGTAYPVKFTVTESQPGTYTVNIDDQKESFIILGASGGQGRREGEIILFALAMAVIALLSGLLIVVARRRFQGY